MAFNKILLLLAALSFGIKIPIKKVDAKSYVPKHDREGIFWDNKYPTWNRDGLLYESNGCDNDFDYGYTVLDNKQKVKDEDETSLEFYAIPVDKIGTLKVGAPRSVEESAGYGGFQPICKGLSVPFGDLEQIGYTAQFLNEDDDFYPSYAYNLFRVPTKQYVVGRDDTLPGSTYTYPVVNGIQYKYVEDIDANCHRQGMGTYVAASRYIFGVVSKECAPNDFTKIPGWNQSYEYDPYDSTKPDTRAKGSAPIARDDCIGSTGDFKAYFKGYSFGTLYNGNLTTLKRALTRYGPVRITSTYLKQDSTVTTGQYPGYASAGGVINSLVIGWNQTHLHTIESFTISDVPAGNRIGYEIPLKYEDDETYNIPFFDTIKVFGNSVSMVRAALSVIAAAVVLPALALFF